MSVRSVQKKKKKKKYLNSYNMQHREKQLSRGVLISYAGNFDNSLANVCYQLFFRIPQKRFFPAGHIT